MVVDGNLTTSRGPSTALAFAYELVEQLGGDAESLRDGMLYRDVFEINSKTRVRLSFLFTPFLKNVSYDCPALLYQSFINQPRFV